MSEHSYTHPLDPYFIAASALLSIPLQAIVLAGAYYLRSSALLTAGTAFNFMVTGVLTWVLGAFAEASLAARGIVLFSFTLFYGLYLFIFSLVAAGRLRKLRRQANLKTVPVESNYRLPPLFWLPFVLLVFVVHLPITITYSGRVAYIGDGGTRVNPYKASDIVAYVLLGLAYIVELVAMHHALDQDEGTIMVTATLNGRGYASSSPEAMVRSTGVYRLTRHPLLITRPILAYGVWLIAAAPAWYKSEFGSSGERLPTGPRVALAVSVLCPTLVYLCSIFLWLPHEEKKQQEHYHALSRLMAMDGTEGTVWASYLAYRERTSPLFPIPSFMYRRLSPGLKRSLCCELPLKQDEVRIGAAPAGGVVEMQS
ncbi:hypothetical protein JCM10207_001632 [Rhodosporidiobolus poonsookiae]